MSEKKPKISRQKLITLRKGLGYSTYNVAHLTGWHRQTVCKLESGEMALTPKYATKLAELYMCSTAELMDDDQMLTTDEVELLRLVKLMTPAGRRRLMEHALVLAPLARPGDEPTGE